MILYRSYDAEKRLDRVWYDSSNILYSECDDRLNELKTLRVTFKNGATYEYKDVNVQDYVMFVHGGTDGSNGKALNKYIKPKCDVEKVESKDIEVVMNEMTKLMKEERNNVK